MSRDTFIQTFGGIYEHSPWVAERLYDQGLDAEHDTPQGLHRAMRRIVDRAGEPRQLTLLRAHPDLVGRAALAGELTADSSAEQASAGLDRCTPAELTEFQDLNLRYQAKFGFPFILAVRNRTRQQVLEAFRARIEHAPETEFATALAEVHKIAGLRLSALMDRPDLALFVAQCVDRVQIGRFGRRNDAE